MPVEDAELKLILVAAFPLETELIGDAVLDQAILSRGDQTPPISLEGGHDFDLSTTLDIVKSAIEFSVACIELYRLLAEKGHRPSPSGLLATLPKAAPPDRLTNEDKKRIAEEVCRAQL